MFVEEKPDTMMAKPNKGEQTICLEISEVRRLQ